MQRSCRSSLRGRAAAPQRTVVPLSATPPAPASADTWALLRHRPFAFYLGARGFSRVLLPDRSRGRGLADLRAHRQRLRPRARGPARVPADRAFHLRRRPRRGPLRAAARRAALPVRLRPRPLAFLAWGTFAGWLTLPQIFAAVIVLGRRGRLRKPGGWRRCCPRWRPPGMLQRATALSTGALQVAMISGPALGGVRLCALARLCPTR